MQTYLHNSPFALLGVSTRDNANKIIEQAEEKSLFLESDICAKARSDLTIVRNRLVSEIRWLPGVSPNKAMSLLNALSSNYESLKDVTSLPPLANSNLLAAVFETLDQDLAASDWQDLITIFAYAVDLINSDDVLREINADRALSGFSEVRSLEQIEMELEERYRFYTDTIKSALNRLEPMKLVEVVSIVVERTTKSGHDHAPRLVHDLVDRYEMETERFLIAEAENIRKLVEAIKLNSHNGESQIKTQVEKLEMVVRKWDAIAQPIQLSKKAQGLDHNLSHDVAILIRSLAVELFNNHDMVSTVNLLTQTLKELFAEVPAVLERLEGDSEAISDILQERELTKKKIAEHDQEITFQTEMGMIFKDTLKISPKGVEWKGRIIPLSDINSVRWGSVRKTVNGIPSGTDYTIGVGGNNVSEFVIHPTNELVYTRFTECLWRGVCVRLLEQYLQALKEGKSFSIGGVTFDDKGIFLTKHKFFGNEKLFENWNNVSYGSYSGSLQIISINDKKAYVILSYLSIPNVHILEAMIRLSSKNWKGRLSDLLVH